jgi:predicted enzyme related to lactoylglutathione lyase
MRQPRLGDTERLSEEGVDMLQKSPLYAYIPAKDVARARRFYEERIGLRPKEEYAGGVIYEFFFQETWSRVLDRTTWGVLAAKPA